MKFKTIIVLFILLIFAIILFQNLKNISIQLLFWEFEMVPLFVLIPLTLLIGVIIGFLLASTKKKKRLKKKELDQV